MPRCAGLAAQNIPHTCIARCCLTWRLGRQPGPIRQIHNSRRRPGKLHMLDSRACWPRMAHIHYDAAHIHYDRQCIWLEAQPAWMRPLPEREHTALLRPSPAARSWTGAASHASTLGTAHSSNRCRCSHLMWAPPGSEGAQEHPVQRRTCDVRPLPPQRIIYAEGPQPCPMGSAEAQVIWEIRVVPPALPCSPTVS